MNHVSAGAYVRLRGHETKSISGMIGGMALKRYRYRAYPTRGQARALARLFGCVRVAWNDALAYCEQTYRDEGSKPSRADVSARLTASKRTESRVWLGEVSSVPLQQSIADLDRAYSNFFASVTGKRKGPAVRPPRFKKKPNRQSARFTRSARFTVWETTHGVGFVTLPKVGRVRFESSRPLPSWPSSVTVVHDPDGRFYVSFVVDVPTQAKAPHAEPAGRVAGVDLGLTDLAIIARSDGTREKVPNPRWLRSRQRKLARAQRALARKQRGSANRVKARRAVAVHHRKVREARLDHHHKLALRLVRENQTVALEGLSVAGLGRTRMARSVHDAGWATLTRLIGEKAVDHHRREVAVIDRWAPTSQTCCVCATPGGKKPLSVREWTCTSCGTRLDRDYNAAVNIILAAGLAESLNACGPDVRRTLACALGDEAGTHRTDPDHTVEAA